VTLSVVESPKQSSDIAALTVTGSAGVAVTFKVVLTQFETQFAFSARTKYVVVTAGTTKTIVVVSITIPPQESVYHFQVAPEVNVPFTVNDALSLLQIDDDDGIIPDGLAGKGNVFKTALVQAEKQFPFSARTK
jgi:hypothetical protein